MRKKGLENFKHTIFIEGKKDKKKQRVTCPSCLCKFTSDQEVGFIVNRKYCNHVKLWRDMIAHILKEDEVDLLLRTYTSVVSFQKTAHWTRSNRKAVFGNIDVFVLFFACLRWKKQMQKQAKQTEIEEARKK